MMPVCCTYIADGKHLNTQCGNQAVYRSAEHARCIEHGGHLDYTERREGEVWVPWEPVYSGDPTFRLAAGDSGGPTCMMCRVDLTIEEIWGFELPRVCDVCLRRASPEIRGMLV